MTGESTREMGTVGVRSLTADVAIVGAGLAGSSLAIGLGRAGVDVVMLDPGRFPRPKLCGEYLSPEAWTALDGLGLSEAIERSGYHPIHRLRLSTPSGRPLDAEVVHTEERPGIALSRDILDHTLIGQARRSGVRVLEGVRVGEAIQDRDGTVIGARGLDLESGSTWDVRARLTVVASGRHARLVRQTGTTRTRSRFRGRLFGLKRHLRVGDASVTDPSGTVALHLVPGGYGGTCRIDDDRLNLCALLPEPLVRRHRGRLDDLAHVELGRNPRLARLLEASEPAGPWKTVSNVRVEISRPTRPGIIYVGDSQGTVDPLGGQGMTMALLGGQLLTPRVLDALVSGRAMDAPRQRAYETAWCARFDRRIHLCRAFHHALVRPSLLDAVSRLGSAAGPILAHCYRWTRDPK